MTSCPIGRATQCRPNNWTHLIRKAARNGASNWLGYSFLSEDIGFGENLQKLANIKKKTLLPGHWQCKADEHQPWNVVLKHILRTLLLHIPLKATPFPNISVFFSLAPTETILISFMLFA